MIVLPFFDVPLECINAAALQYHVPAKLIISILQVERGKIGQISKNKNGSYDIGPAQINSSWLPQLKKQGITQADLEYNSCVNVQVATWILSKKIAHRKNMLVGIGDYNSHTYQFNHAYYNKIRMQYSKLQRFLD